MANAIEKFKKYISLLDEVYKQASLTARLDSDSTLAQAGANANEIIIPKLSMEGLAEYDRNSGYVNGDVTMTYETLKDHPLIDKSTIGLSGSPTNILTSFTPPQKGAGMMLEGDGRDTTDKLAGILAAKHII